MDKVVNRYDVNPKGRPLLLDAMDQITGINELQVGNPTSLCVETQSNSADNDKLCVETSTTPEHSETLSPKHTLHVETSTTPEHSETLSPKHTLHVETPVIKSCSVRLVSLESILFPKKGNTSDKHSSTTAEDTAKVPHVPNVPTPTPLSSDGVKSPDEPKRSNASGTIPTLDDAYSVETDVDEPPTKVVPVSRGTKRKYGCRLCTSRFESAQALKDHHVQTHGIMYCSDCSKAFNNQLSLTRHKYEHKSHPFVCNTCGDDFPFESQYQTHLLTHSDCRKHACNFTNCNRRFKNKGDLNRHLKEHSSTWMTCPDCPEYKTKQKRNFELHRLKHSQIEKYWCERCGKGFVFNTQKLRHVNKRLCKRSN